MGNSWKRSINMYININGQEVKNDVKTIRGEMQHLINSQAKMTIGSQEYVKASRNIASLNSILKQHRENIGQIQTPLQKVISFAKGLLPAFGLTALIGGIKSIFTNVIQIRKEFEKYEAVLTNTLGSNKKARQEMQMLQEFAAETPFVLTELTGSFVKLTNYGLKPSRDEMRKYGDLASSVGKGFDQLAEAVADSVTGEFERLKEFGIKAKKEGDQITFTFKEQSTVVQNNADAIKNYIIGLGDLKGVSGSMAAIAATLGGKISNMGDSWDGLMNTMGSGTSGIFVTVIGWMTSFVNTLDGALKSVQMIKEAVKDKSVVDSMNNAIKEIDVMEKSLMRNGMSQAEAHTKAIELYNKSINDGIASTQASFNGKTTEQKSQLAKQLNLMIEERKAVTEHFKSLDEIKKNQKSAKTNNSKTSTVTNDETSKAIEIAYKEQQLSLKDKYESEETLQKEYKARMLANDLAYIIAKQNLTNDDSTYLDLQSQYIDKQREYTAALKETVPELLATHDGTENLNSRLLEEAKLMDFVASKQAEAATATEEMKAKQESLANMYQGTIEGISSGIYELASGSEDALKTMAKNLLIFALEQLKIQAEIAIAGVTIQGLASLNPVQMLVAAVKIAAIEAVFAGLEGLVNKSFSSKKEKNNGYASGGYTGSGNKNEVAGPVHKGEYVIPKKILDTPLGAAYAANLEAMRTNPVTVTQSAIEVSKSFSGSTRSATVSQTSPQSQDVAVQTTTDTELKKVLEENTGAMKMNSQAIALLMKKGVSFPIVAGIKKMKEVEDLINQTGMPGFKK